MKILQVRLSGKQPCLVNSPRIYLESGVPKSPLKDLVFRFRNRLVLDDPGTPAFIAATSLKASIDSHRFPHPTTPSKSSDGLEVHFYSLITRGLHACARNERRCQKL